VFLASYGNSGSVMLRGKFVYCGTLGVVYKRMRHSEKGPSKQKEKENNMKGNFFSNL
jgi:hypothetical protein